MDWFNELVQARDSGHAGYEDVWPHWILERCLMDNGGIHIIGEAETFSDGKPMKGTAEFKKFWEAVGVGYSMRHLAFARTWWDPEKQAKDDPNRSFLARAILPIAIRGPWQDVEGSVGDTPLFPVRENEPSNGKPRRGQKLLPHHVAFIKGAGDKKAKDVVSLFQKEFDFKITDRTIRKYRNRK
ncbi:hypothetical protein HY256_02120 [Candidatus Sumerlaeota bacterium]|nr:hypothetical protein [Candidatus Sumerlaeota bacterium]